MAIKTVGVLGCGLMGAGIAQISAGAGFKTIVLEVNEDALKKGLGRIEKFLTSGIEKGKVTGSPVAVADWTAYVKRDTNLYLTGADLFGETYGDQVVDTLPKVPTNTYNNLSDVTDGAFWSPFN